MIRSAIHDPELQRAALALVDNQLHVAEPILKARLKEDPFDVAAIRMLAELVGDHGTGGHHLVHHKASGRYRIR